MHKVNNIVGQLPQQIRALKREAKLLSSFSPVRTHTHAQIRCVTVREQNIASHRNICAAARCNVISLSTFNVGHVTFSVTKDIGLV